MLVNMYNKRSMKKYGWNPEWLGLEYNTPMPVVVAAVKAFQRSLGLKPDSKVGPTTFRRLQAHNELRQLECKERHDNPAHGLSLGGNFYPTAFPSVPFDTRNGLSLYRAKHYKPRKTQPRQVVWHWDAALSAKSCHKILSGTRKASTHGCIDNDGTFYQFLDFDTVYAWHAGISKVNKASIGLDFSNAVYTKYNKWYTSHGHGARPVIKAKTNGANHRLLGYYPAQIETAAHLVAFIQKRYGIPLYWPGHHNRFPQPHMFKGHYGHYHCKKGKWDPAGMPWDTIMLRAQEIITNG